MEEQNKLFQKLKLFREQTVDSLCAFMDASEYNEFKPKMASKETIRENSWNWNEYRPASTVLLMKGKF